jgi:hypothetical protein
MSVFDDVLSAFGITASNLLKAVDPTATPTNVAATDATTAGATILTKIVGGQTIVPFTSSNSAWTIPLGVTRMFAGVINGGNKGTTGSTSTGGTAAGGTGGLDGGYIWGELTLTGLTAGTDTLNITVGAAAGSPGGTGGVSSIVAVHGNTHHGCVEHVRDRSDRRVLSHLLPAGARREWRAGELCHPCW